MARLGERTIRRRALRWLASMAAGAAAAGVAAQAGAPLALVAALEAARLHTVVWSLSIALLWPLAGGELLASGQVGLTAAVTRGWPAALAAAGGVGLWRWLLAR